MKHEDVFCIVALMMGAASTSETSVNFYKTTRRNIPEDSHFHIDASLQPVSKRGDCIFMPLLVCHVFSTSTKPVSPSSAHY
jgi:hypothetical protein